MLGKLQFLHFENWDRERAERIRGKGRGDGLRGGKSKGAEGACSALGDAANLNPSTQNLNRSPCCSQQSRSTQNTTTAATSKMTRWEWTSVTAWNEVVM